MRIGNFMQNVRAFLYHLDAGVRLLAFAPASPFGIRPSLRHVVISGALAGALWLVFDRLAAPGEVSIVWASIAQVAWLGAIFFGVLLLMSPAGRDPAATVLVLTAVASMLPGYVLLVFAFSHFGADTAFARWTPFVLAAVSAAYLVRIVRWVPGSRLSMRLASAIVAVGATWLAFDVTVGTRPQMWRAVDDAAGASAALAVEELMYRQPMLIEHAARDLAPQTPGHTDVYFVGFAGDGNQAVFGKEVAFAHEALSQKLDIESRIIELVNAPHADARTPMATSAGLRMALQRVRAAMDADEDVLLLFMTSHGTPQATLAVHQPGWPLQDLSSAALASALHEAGIKWRIIIISACYSGSFIDPLKDEHTLIVTAARADRQSFGCRDDSELTYYGQALFRDALPQSRGLLDAAARAAAIVTERERTEDMKPSEPQMWVGAKMRTKIGTIGWRATGVLTAGTASIRAARRQICSIPRGPTTR